MATALLLVAIVIFAAGIALGVSLLVSWGIRREERYFQPTRQAPGLTGQGARQAPDLISQGARRMTGLLVRRTAPALERRPDMLA